MIRLLAILLICLPLAAGAQQKSIDGSRIKVPKAPAGISKTTGPAKFAFGSAKRGSAQKPNAFGGYARGCFAGGEELAETGPTWQAMRLSRNRNWGAS